MTILTVGQITEKSEPIFKAFGIKEAYLFGSYARGEASEDSDVDFYFIKNTNMSMLELIKLRHELESALDKKVDVVSNIALELNMDKPNTQKLMREIQLDKREVLHAS